MKKNIPIILFFIFVVIATFLTSYFAEAAKVSSFMEDQKELYSNDYNFLIQKSIIAYYRDKTDAYVLKSPVYAINHEEDLNKLEFVVKSYMSFNKNSTNKGVAFIIQNISVDDVFGLLDDHGQPIIDVKIYYSSSFVYNEKEFIFSTETFVPVSDTGVGLFFIDYEILRDINNEYVEINKLEFFYRTDSNPKLFLSLDGANDGFIEAMSINNVLFNESFPNDLIYHNNSLIKKYKSFNSYYFKYLSIEAIIVIVILYFSFFHKDVMKKYRSKKYKQQELYNTLKTKKEKEKDL